MIYQQEIDVLHECYNYLEDALSSLEDIDIVEDEKITKIYWEIKDVQSTINKHLEYFRESSK